MKNHIFLKLFLLIFTISLTFTACNEENTTSTPNVTKKIIPNGPVNIIVSYPSDRLYNTNHEWIKFENDSIASMGITDYAIQLFGSTCSIDEEEDIPILIDRDTASINPFNHKKISLITGTLGSMYFTIDFKGCIVYLKNPLVDNDPSLVSVDPYGSGWIYKISDYDTTGGNFMNSNEYFNFVNTL